MIDDRTSTLNLPKPNKDNTLIDDVQRLRDVLDGADAAIAGKAGTVHGHAISDVSGLSDALAAKQDSLGFSPENPANKGAANGYAGLDSTGRVPAAQLPSFVDDVVEYASLAAFPATGETGKIYIALDTNREYRWSGSTYIWINPSPGSTDAIPEGSTNLYYTAARAKAASAYGAATKSSSYSVTAADSKTMLRANTATGPATYTLPQISTLSQDFDVLIAKVTGDTNLVSIARSGSDSINGATTYNLTSQWQGAWLIADRSTNTWTVISSGASSGVNTVVDTFTGSGTAGPFALAGDPGSKNNTAVYVGGVYQQKSTYSLAGANLTLGGTVAAGVTIEVIWSTPLAIGTPADGTVTPAKMSSGAPSWDSSGNVTGADGLLKRYMLQDTGWDFHDSGTTSALDYVNGSVQRWAPATGAQTLSITNWPPSGAMGELLIEGINLGAATITWPTINWVKSDGTTTTTFSSNGVTLQSSGTDWVFLWTRDAGTTIYGKVVR